VGKDIEQGCSPSISAVKLGEVSEWRIPGERGKGISKGPACKKEHGDRVSKRDVNSIGKNAAWSKVRPRDCGIFLNKENEGGHLIPPNMPTETRTFRREWKRVGVMGESNRRRRKSWASKGGKRAVKGTEVSKRSDPDGAARERRAGRGDRANWGADENEPKNLRPLESREAAGRGRYQQALGPTDGAEYERIYIEKRIERLLQSSDRDRAPFTCRGNGCCQNSGVKTSGRTDYHASRSK